jgi:hypothetical protein
VPFSRVLGRIAGDQKVDQWRRKVSREAEDVSAKEQFDDGNSVFKVVVGQLGLVLSAYRSTADTGFFA